MSATKPPARNVVIDALQAVAHFWGKDPKAFGDDATLGTIATAFGPVAEKCEKALKYLRDQAGIDPDAAKIAGREPVSPCDCKHERTLFIQGGRGSPPPMREHVSLCADCGTFRVFREVAGERMKVQFQLVTAEHMEAAGQFIRLMAEEQATANEVAAAKFRAEIRQGDGKPEGTRESLERCARMLDTHAPDLFPANDKGQVHFARAMMESVADEIRAFLEAHR